MADNFTTNAGSGGDTFAADDIGGVKHQRVKIEIGADGAASDVSSSNPLPISDNGGSLTVDGTIAFSNITIAVTNVGTFAVQASQAGTWVLGANSGVDIGDVDVTSVIPGFAASNLGKRTDDPATTSDVGVALLAKRTGTPANFSSADGDYEPLQMSAGRLHTSAQATGSVAHDAVDSGNPVKVGGKASSSAPTAVAAADRVDAYFDLNGRLVVLIDSALPAGTNAIGKLAANSGVDIGDVDVTSVPAPLNVTGGGVESTALRVTIASDSTGVLSVDDNGSSITVDGTVAFSNTTIAVTNVGTFAVQATIAAGATNIAKAEDVASADADVGVPAMAVRKATPANTSGTDGDYEMLQMSAGRLWVDASGVTLTVGSHAVTNAGTFAVQQTTGTSGGTLLNSQLSTAAVISTSVKASAGQVYGIHCFNNGANEVFLRLYNQTGAPAGGDNANIVYRAMIPGNTAGAGFVVNIPPGMEFSTGIGVRVTGAVGDTDTTALTANEVMVNILYK